MADVTAGGWVDPPGRELGRIAPTTANALIECSRRVAYARDARTQGLARTKPQMAVGSVAHRLTELVLKGKAVDGEGRRAWLEDTWADLIGTEFDRLCQAWPGREVPRVVRWPGYIATRARLLRRLEKVEPAVVAGRLPRKAAGAGLGDGVHAPLPWIERKLVDDSRMLYGTPDLVEMRESRLRVVDLKTGVHQGDVRPGQRRQLLLYAHLVNETLARDVDEAAVVDVRGRESVVGTGRHEVEGVVASVMEARDLFERGPDGRAPRAHPDPVGCSRCPFRVVCEPFWNARQPDWPGGGIDGPVTAVHPLGVADVGHGDSMQRLILADGVAVSVGDDIAAVDLDEAGPRSFRMRWDSAIRVNSTMP